MDGQLWLLEQTDDNAHLRQKACGTMKQVRDQQP